MAVRTWVGGGSNSATDPTQWAEGIIPAPGDDLHMSGGTINIIGDPFFSGTMNVDDPSNGTTRPPIVFNLSGDATLDQNMSQTPISSGTMTINLDQTRPTTWTGGFGSSFTDVIVNGGGTWINGQSGINGASAVIDPDVVAGSGPNQFFVNAAQRSATSPWVNGSLEFKGSVGPVLTVDVEGNAQSEAIATLHIDKALSFSATVTLGFGEIVLEGLGPVDSFQNTGTTLSLFSGNTLVDNLALDTTGTSGLGVSKTVVDGVDAVVIHGDGAAYRLGGTALPDNSNGNPATPAEEANFSISDQTTKRVFTDPGLPYTGPAASVKTQYINITPDSLNIAAVVPNVFIHSGAGDDAIDVSKSGGNNVLDGSTGSNFLVGGGGNDTFFVDARAAKSDTWSTVSNFHAGDALTVWGLTKADFPTFTDNQGAVGFTGLTMHTAKPGEPIASFTLPGFTNADLASGKVTTAFGHTNDLPGLPGSDFMMVQTH